MTLSVLALTRYDRMGASSRVRFLQYIPYLQRQDIRVETHALLDRHYLARLYDRKSRDPLGVAVSWLNRLWRVLQTKEFDAIWVQREVLPFLPYVFEKTLLAGKPVVSDFDDAHHLYYRELPLAPLRSVFGEKIDRLMRESAAVVVGNSTLEDYARSVGASSVVQIPSAVDVSKYPAAAPSGPFTVGWIGTPVTAQQSLPLIAAPLKKFLLETGARCILVGAGDEVVPDLPAERIPWTETIEAEALSRITVGICPLEDSPWTRGKSGYKVMQYMAAGRACLVSPVGIAADLITPERTGAHCRNAGEWYAALVRLHAHRDDATRMGQAARNEALEKYDTPVAATQLAAVFRDVTGR